MEETAMKLASQDRRSRKQLKYLHELSVNCIYIFIQNKDNNNNINFKRKYWLLLHSLVLSRRTLYRHHLIENELFTPEMFVVF